MARTVFPDEYEEDLSAGRWSRSRGSHRSRKWLRILLIAIVLPLLLGAAVAAFAGRPLAFEAIRRLTLRKLPNVQWIDGTELARWRDDPGRAPPVVLDARTADEYAVSHLAGALRIEPYRPLLRPLRGFSKDTAIVVYSSAGYRGARVANWLAGQGYSRVTNLEGGLFRWVNDGRPVFRSDRPTIEVHPYDPNWGLLLKSRYRISAPPIEKRSAAP
jgi:rhodanese-related sulfurtransferase